jgi:DNA-binding response OmpR family regulator
MGNRHQGTVHRKPRISSGIEAIVRSLRRNLGDRAAAIETVRGVGYRFVAGA